MKPDCDNADHSMELTDISPDLYKLPGEVCVPDDDRDGEEERDGVDGVQKEVLRFVPDRLKGEERINERKNNKERELAVSE